MEDKSSDTEKQSTPPPDPQSAPDQPSETGGLRDFLKGLIVFAVLMVPLFSYLIWHEWSHGRWTQDQPTTSKSRPAEGGSTTSPAP